MYNLSVKEEKYPAEKLVEVLGVGPRPAELQSAMRPIHQTSLNQSGKMGFEPMIFSVKRRIIQCSNLSSSPA